jgi:hypothetical protein
MHPSRHAKTVGQPLHQDGLPGSQVTFQADDVAWMQDPGETPTNGPGLLG